MKKLIFSLGFTMMTLSSTIFSQEIEKKGPIISSSIQINKNTPTQNLMTPDVSQLQAEDILRDQNGELYRIGVPIFTNISTLNSGLWTTKTNGERVWELKIKASGAEALSFIFSNFKLYGNSVLTVSNLKGELVHKPVTKDDMLEDFQQHLALCFGDELALRLTEPAGTQASEIHMDRVMYNYRSTGNPSVQKINESDACEVNVNCTPVGDIWQDEKRGASRIYVVDGGGAGWCSGSLVNNITQNCRPYMLLALHCGVSTSAANSNLWRFYFRYEAPTCINPGTAGTLDDYYITGCVRITHSNDGGGNTGSDFLLVQMGTIANEATTITTLKTANFNAYWCGWDANNTATTGGASIHHPAGDIKKISTFTGTTVSAAWGIANTHWRVVWTANANGHGVTEGGSSGSPIFKSNGRIFGTLTGGSSYCTALSDPDLYGKMSYHWISNSANTAFQLKTFLDPGNTGVLVMDGSSNPCSAPAVPIANFSGSPTSVSSGGIVSFTDLTSGVPTTWTWTISPGTAGTEWSYTAGTTASSQNPQVIFNTVGQYTISLYAANGIGNDTETKPNYITVVSGPCAATSTSCDEFISNVTLNTINNSSACTNYANYTAISTTLNIGSQYTVTLTPQVGATPNTAYTNDELAVWIDWNNDNDFIDVGEQVGYVLVAAGWSPVFTFTVPAAATIGTLRMRCRISYQPDDGAIVPCGTTIWGEVEDYSVTIQVAPVGVLTLSCGPNQTITASTQGTTMPNVTGPATESTTCAGGVITLSQSPLTGSPLSNGANAVTVTAIDECGNTQTCQVTVTFNNDLGVEDINQFSFVTLYPNPVSALLLVDLSTVANEDVIIELYDMAGKLLTKRDNKSGAMVSIDMRNFANGFYYVKLSSKTTQTMRKISKI